MNPKFRYLFGAVLWGIVWLHASEIVEILAGRVEWKRGKAYAYKDVVVFYGDTTLHARRVIYDKDAHRIILDGQVETEGYRGVKTHASHVEIDTKNKEVSFRKLFFANSNDIWLLSRKALKHEGNYTFEKSLFSSCDISDPVWKMNVEKTVYDSRDKYVEMYGTTVYLKNMPVMYTPYLSFSTDNRRRSGLLFPWFGYTSEEGFVYEQPVYWAIDESMDVEFNPQIRTSRSVGIYATYRFVDSPVSHGQLRVGYFKDKHSYTVSHDLPDDRHYGMQFVYERNEVVDGMRAKDFRDGLYVDVTLLNDIDYLNLQKSPGIGFFGQSPIQQSFLNYYVDNNRWYGGINAKYFIDTRLPGNDTTVQTLPSIQAHRYVDRLFTDNFTYSLDFQVKNLTRPQGVTMRQAEGRIPLEFTLSLFDDYMSLQLGEAFYFGAFRFDNDPSLVYDDFSYANNIHYAKMFSDLTAHIGKYIHIIQPSFSYILPGNEHTGPVDFETLTSLQPQIGELFTVGLPEEAATFMLNHYLYGDDGKLIFFQRLAQQYYPDREEKMGNLENEMMLAWKKWKLYNRFVYSHAFSALEESSTSIHYHDDRFGFEFGHTYKKSFDDDSATVLADDLQLGFQYRLKNGFYVDGRWNYDLEERGLQRWRIGGGYSCDCWSAYASVQADVQPRPVTSDGTSRYTQQYGFYVQVNFKPFGEIASSTEEESHEGF